MLRKPSITLTRKSFFTTKHHSLGLDTHRFHSSHRMADDLDDLDALLEEPYKNKVGLYFS